MKNESSSAALGGLKVIELGQLIAGPFAAKLLGEFGAEIIKIEPPDVGDPLRKWRKLENGTSLWWHVQSRNKKSVTLDLKAPEGQEILRKLLKDADILIENFRPGTMEKWGLGWEQLSQLNPKLIMVRVSGYGQTGPYRDLPGFGVIGEAMGGLRYLTGEPGRPPVRCGISIGDSISALYAVIGVLLALHHRNQHSGKGQCIDVALYESVFGMMESLIPEYDYFGYVREPSGAALPGIAPTNAYLCRGGKYVLIGGNGDGIFKRLMNVMGRDDLGNDPRFAHNDGRAQEAAFLDATIEEWTKQHEVYGSPGKTERRRRSGWISLHRRRHRRRPALPGARDDSDHQSSIGQDLEGAGRVAQAERHSGADRRRGPGAGRAYGRGALGDRH